jgi:hypothetical protein
MKTFAQVRDAIIETYDAAEEHLDKANVAHQEGKLGEYHRHMTNFHDAMSEWHDDRGRSGSSDKHSRLADEHDDKARELGEEFVVSEDVTDHKYNPHNHQTMKTSKGHTHMGITLNSKGNKGANILKHGDTGKYFAAGGSASGTNARTTYHDTPEAAAKEYHSRYKKTVSEAMSARLKLADALRKRQEAREAAQKRNQEWLKGGSEKKEEKPEVKEEKMKGKDPCWTGYKMLGTKNKNGKQVPNCIPESIEESIARLVSNSIKKVTTRKITPQEKADIRLNK